jgi:AGZA family xanthine/uracil permease-like MFS transporter
MEKFFKLKENGTTVRTEVIAGITTFFTMAYIIFVNPNILGTTGMDTTSVMIATCIAAAVGTALTGLLSNYPFAQASGMGLTHSSRSLSAARWVTAGSPLWRLFLFPALFLSSSRSLTCAR